MSRVKDVNVATSMGSVRLAVIINERLHYPSKASAERLDRVLTSVTPDIVFITPYGPSVRYTVGRPPEDNHVVWYAGAEKVIGKHPGIWARDMDGCISPPPKPAKSPRKSRSR